MSKKSLPFFVIFLLVFSIISCSNTPTPTMQESAEAFLSSLNDQQKKKALAEFSHKNRTDWVFLPDKFIKAEKVRFGLPLKEMSEEQQKLAFNLLNSALSDKGQLKVNQLRMLEDFLLETTKETFRDSKLYYVSIFGTPSDHHTWGWTFEGHHLSINFTLINGKHLSLTPTFYGSNPGIIKEGDKKGLQVLASEENIAREIAKSLTKEQLAKAEVFKGAPKDIFSLDFTKVERETFDIKKGLPYAEMTDAQKEKIKELIKVYIENFRPELITQLDNSPLSEIDSLVFVWVGETEINKPHYYRLVTKNHLIEYDNVQNGANHPHTAWREFDGDFGADLLKKHHHEDQHHEHKH